MWEILKTLMIVLATLQTTACIGLSYSQRKAIDGSTSSIYVSTKGENVNNPVFSDFVEAYGKPEEAFPGKTYIFKTKKNVWCGAIVWAGLPIPLRLPVCSKESHISFNDLGQPSARIDKYYESNYLICSPLFTILKAMSQSKEDGFFCM